MEGEAPPNSCHKSEDIEVRALGAVSVFRCWTKVPEPEPVVSRTVLWVVFIRGEGDDIGDESGEEC